MTYYTECILRYDNNKIHSRNCNVSIEIEAKNRELMPQNILLR